MPRAVAILATSVGSMPRMRWPPFLKFEISVPSFEPMSMTRSSVAEPEHLRGFGIELGEIVAQQLGRAAGVGIFGREDDDGIDREAELHQLAFRAVQQIGRKPGLLPRHLADRHHLIHRRHVAERQHGRRAAHGRRPGSIRPGRLRRCRRRARLFSGTRLDLLGSYRDVTDRTFGARPSCAQYQSERRRQALRRARRAGA